MKKLIICLAALIPAFAVAHPGHEQASFISGLVGGALHPLLGLDHLLALLAVGLFSANLSGKARYMLPLSFIAMMAVGFYSAHAGWHGVTAGAIEFFITLSIGCAIVLGVMTFVMKKNQLLNSASAYVMTGFAVFHGLAHGLEIPAGASLNSFALGFLAMSSILITASYFLVQNISKHQSRALKPVSINSKH